MAFYVGNLCYFNTPTTGTGTLSVGTAVTGYMIPSQAGVPPGSTTGYRIIDGQNNEVGRGTLTSGTPWTMSRDTVENSIIGGVAGTTKMTLSGSAFVMLTQTAGSLPQPGATAPLMNGTAAIGASLNFAPIDHVHPSDTTRAPTNNPVFTGTVTLAADPTLALQAATKQYVDAQVSGSADNITAAGTTQATATLLNAPINTITGGSAGGGVRLNPAFPAQRVNNRWAGTILPVFPPSGQTVEGYALNAAAGVAVNGGALYTLASGSTTWRIAA